MIKIVRQGNGYRIERHRENKKTEIYHRDGRWSTNYNGALYISLEAEALRQADRLKRAEVGNNEESVN